MTTTPQPARRLEYMPLDVIEPALANPKTHDQELIAASMERFGYIEAIVLDERTGRLVAGHGRTEQLAQRRAAGLPPPDGVEVAYEDGNPEAIWLVPVVRGWSSTTDDEAHAAGVALNRIGEAGGWDDRALTDLLRDLNEGDPDAGLIGTGFDPMVLANLLMVTRTAAEVADFDAAAEWVGLPDYTPEELPWKLVVQFKDNETRERFLDELHVREQITFTHADKRTISAWFPVRDAPVHDTGLRWEDAEDDAVPADEAAGP